MSNVLIGIAGVILFIGLALAGASFFGPTVSGSVQDSKSMALMRVLSEAAVATSVRNRETESLVPAASTIAALVPDYVAELPVSPLDGNPIMLMSSVGSTSTGAASYVVVLVNPTQTGIGACQSANLAAGGTSPVPSNGFSSGAIYAQRTGCMQMGTPIGPFAATDYVAYQKI